MGAGPSTVRRQKAQGGRQKVEASLPRRILIVDDTSEIAELLTFALRDRGYDVTSSGYTTNITELVAEQGAQAVVLDCSVYDMSESLFDTLRGEPSYQALPVVVITDTPEDAVPSLRSRNARHVLLVRKPFTGAQVAAALEQLLGPP